MNRSLGVPAVFGEWDAGIQVAEHGWESSARRWLIEVEIPPGSEGAR
jgi:hypothetical protein